MKKIIVLVISCLILTSCSANTKWLKLESNILSEEVESNPPTEKRITYINDDMKSTVDEINSLRDKYKDSLDENEFHTIYIDIYDKDNRLGGIQDTFTLNNIHGRYPEEYFNDVVEILDKNEAVGLKNYIKKASDMDINPGDVIIKKIGRTVVHVEGLGVGDGSRKNHIAIKMRLTNIRDEDYRDIFENISRDKYILDNVYREREIDVPVLDPLSRDLISFVNDERFMNNEISDFAKIRYELLLKDKEINKVNILLSRKNDEKLKKDDIEVFINLLRVLDLKEEDRGELLKAYRNAFEEKIQTKDFNIEGYGVYVKNNKGNNYIGDRKENIYISIEKDLD